MEETDMIVYALYFDKIGIDPNLFYLRQEKAREELKVIRKRIKNSIVQVIADEPDRFEYVFGWEEKGGAWVIKPIEVIE